MHRPEQGLQIGIFNMLKPIMAYQKCREFIAFHVGNGGKRTKFEGKIFKAMGVMPGVADIILLFPAVYEPIKPRGQETAIKMLEHPRVCFVEIKAKGGPQTQSQKDFQGWVEAFGFEYVIIEAVNTTDAWNQMRAILRRYGVSV